MQAEKHDCDDKELSHRWTAVAAKLMVRLEAGKCRSPSLSGLLLQPAHACGSELIATFRQSWASSTSVLEARYSLRCSGQIFGPER